MIRSVCASIGMAVLVGCEPPAAEDFLTFRVQTVAEVDVACDADTGECQGNDVVDARIEFGAPLTLAAMSVEFLQYEVDYDFGDGQRAPPTYGGPTQIYVASGTERRFSLRTAGLDQRQFVAAYYPLTRMEGKGTITLFGYDQQNELVTVKGPFDVVFDDFLGGGNTVAP